MSETKSYFGLDIVDGRYVHFSEIEKLPFFDFWSESALSSAMLTEARSGADLVHLADLEAFSQLFIKSGRHRNMPVDDAK